MTVQGLWENFRNLARVWSIANGQSRLLNTLKKGGYEVKHEHAVKGNGAIDILAARGSRKVVAEVETGKSNIKANLDNIKDGGFDRIVFVATSPTAVSACQRAIEAVEYSDTDTMKLLTWLDVS